jgi:hypothetical protein
VAAADCACGCGRRSTETRPGTHRHHLVGVAAVAYAEFERQHRRLGLLTDFSTGDAQPRRIAAVVSDTARSANPKGPAPLGLSRRCRWTRGRHVAPHRDHLSKLAITTARQRSSPTGRCRRRRWSGPRPSVWSTGGRRARWAASLAVTRQHSRRSGSCAQFSKAGMPRKKNMASRSAVRGRVCVRVRRVRVGPREIFTDTELAVGTVEWFEKVSEFQVSVSRPEKVPSVAVAVGHTCVPKNSADRRPSADRPTPAHRAASLAAMHHHLPPPTELSPTVAPQFPRARSRLPECAALVFVGAAQVSVRFCTWAQVCCARGPSKSPVLERRSRMQNLLGAIGWARRTCHYPTRRSPPPAGLLRWPPTVGLLRWPPPAGLLRSPPPAGLLRWPPTVGLLRWPPTVGLLRPLGCFDRWPEPSRRIFWVAASERSSPTGEAALREGHRACRNGRRRGSPSGAAPRQAKAALRGGCAQTLQLI